MTDQKTTVTFLGTDSVVPGPGQDTATLVINGRYQVDTGWYSTIKMRSYGIDPLDLDYLFMTHFHHDHYISMPQLLFYNAMRHYKETGYKPLHIAGPREDLERVVELSRQFLQAEKFPEAACPVVLHPLSPGDELEDENFHASIGQSIHPVPALCYKFTDKKTGATICFTGDTAYSPAIVEHAKGVDLLITEASHGANAADPNNAYGHQGAPDAARMASEAGARRLALMHCNVDKRPGAVAAGQAIFPNTFWPGDGETIVVEAGKG
jgi:ribonuclease Z